jgi:hypothetical protein
VRAGYTFFLTDRAVDTHHWVVISDPERDAEHVVLVSVTTYAPHKEAVCLLDVGDHPAVSHPSCIAYNEARVTTLETLTRLRDGGHLNLQSPVTLEHLARIRAGVNRSMRIKYKYIEILLDQEVIE